MALNDSANYSPSSSAVEKANAAVGSGTANTATINRVTAEEDADFNMSNSSNILGVLKSIEKQQSATRVDSDNKLGKIINILDNKDDSAVRNRNSIVTSMIDTISSLRTGNTVVSSDNSSDEDSDTSTIERRSNNNDEGGIIEEQSGTGNEIATIIDDNVLNHEMLDELMKLNQNAEKMGTNITSGFQASLDEAEKMAALTKKIEDIKAQRKKEDDNKLLKYTIKNSARVSADIGDAVGAGMDKTVSGVTQAIGGAMGDNDKMLVAGLMASVQTFKSTVSGFKSMGEGISKGVKWFSGVGRKNSQGKEGSTIEEKTLAAYEEQLEKVKESHTALLGIGGSLDLESELAYQQLMAELTEDIEKDLTEILKVFNNGIAPEDATTDNLISDMDDVGEVARINGIEDIQSAVITPTDLAEDDVKVDADQDAHEIEQNKIANEQLGASEELNSTVQKIAEHMNKAERDDLKNEKKDRLDEAFAAAESKNKKKNEEEQSGGGLGGLGGMMKSMKNMKGIVDVIRGVSKAFNVLKTIFNVIRTVVMALGVAFSALGAFIFSVPGAIAIAIAAVAGALWYFWDDITGIWGDIFDWFADGWNSLVEGWNDFWDSLLDPVFAAWDGFIGWISESIDKLIWMIKNPLDAAADIATGDNDNYNEYKEEQKKEKEVAAEKEKQRLKEEAEAEAKEEEEYNKPKPEDELYTKEEIKATPKLFRDAKKEHNRKARSIIATRKNEERAQYEKKRDEDIAKIDKQNEGNPLKINLPQMMKDAEEQNKTEEELAGDREIANFFDTDDVIRNKERNELYTEDEIRRAAPEARNRLEGHNAAARMMIGAQKQKEVMQAKEAKVQAAAEWEEQNKDKKLPLVTPKEDSESKSTGFNLMGMLGAQDKKEADAASKTENTSVNIQNNTSNSNVTSNGGGGGNKTYVYSGIVPTAPQGGVIIGATD